MRLSADFYSSVCSYSLFAAAALTCTAAGEPLSKSDEKPADVARMQQLLKILANDNPKLRSQAVKAANEIAILWHKDQAIRKALLGWVARNVKGDNLDTFDNLSLVFVDALASGGPAAIPDLLETLKEEKQSPTSSAACLAALGQMGNAAKAAIPPLHELLKSSKTNPLLKPSIRAVLANLGEPAMQNLKTILELDRKAAKSNDEQLRDREAVNLARGVLFRMRRCTWANDQFVKELRSELEATIEIIKKQKASYGDIWLFQTPVILATAGERAACSAESLEELLQIALRDKMPAHATLCALAIARIRPSCRAEVMRQTLASSRDFANEPFVNGMILDLAFGPLLDKELAAEVFKLAKSDDERVAETALSVLGIAGHAARLAAPAVLEYVEKGAEYQPKLKMAELLPSICNYSHLDSLKRLKSRVNDGATENRLERAIQAIEKLE